MIVIDEPLDWGGAFNRRWCPSAHLMSDLDGEAGTRELVAFAEALGIPRAALQHPGTAREHFDLAGPWLQAAREAGATVIDRYRLVAILQARRARGAPR